jgi:hypothetical protein
MESTEVLRDSVLWSAEQPHRTGVVTGLVRSVRKLAGAEPRIPTPSQVESGGGKSEHDLVRQMAELRVNRKALHEHADEARACFIAACLRASTRAGALRKRCEPRESRRVRALRGFNGAPGKR